MAVTSIQAFVALLTSSPFNTTGIILISSSSAGQKDLSDDTQIAVIGSLEPEIFTKMLKTWREKNAPNFPSTKFGYSVVRIFPLDDAFSEIRELDTSPKEGQQLPLKNKMRRKRKGEKTKSLKTYVTFLSKSYLEILFSIYA